jgi:FTR1 family protein
MWQGMAAAAAVSVAAGVIVHLTIEQLTGEPRLLAFAAVSLLAVAVLTWMIFWMRRQAHRLRGELQDSVDQAITGGGNVRLAGGYLLFLLSVGWLFLRVPARSPARSAGPRPRPAGRRGRSG